MEDTSIYSIMLVDVDFMLIAGCHDKDWAANKRLDWTELVGKLSLKESYLKSLQCVTNISTSSFFSKKRYYIRIKKMP